jgi:hypothetical protein
MRYLYVERSYGPVDMMYLLYLERHVGFVYHFLFAVPEMKYLHGEECCFRGYEVPLPVLD